MGKEVGNEQLFEFMTKIYGEMQEGFKEVRNEFGGLKGEVGGLKGEVKKINVKIDHEIMPKIDTLYDGYKQNSDKLDRIEEGVSENKEMIYRRIK